MVLCKLGMYYYHTIRVRGFSHDAMGSLPNGETDLALADNAHFFFAHVGWNRNDWLLTITTCLSAVEAASVLEMEGPPLHWLTTSALASMVACNLSTKNYVFNENASLGCEEVI